jgi:glycosyltransferase involved in cell wall biosynthesis
MVTTPRVRLVLVSVLCEEGGAMSDGKSRVSIGLPVFNGEKYLAEALDSILAQTFADFELIISDNASTDRTPEICRAYTARDSRVRYFRNETNLGAARNFDRVFELSSGEYFKWAAHDDVCAPEFLERCVKVLDQDASVVLCHPRTTIIDEQGRPMFRYIVKLDTDSTRPHERFREVIGVRHWCFQVFGVARASVLRMTPLIAGYTGSDRNLLAELGLFGRIHEIPEYLFFRRDHPQTSTSMFPDNRKRMAWFDPTRAGWVRFPSWLKFRGYFMSVMRVPMSGYERMLCFIHLSRWVVEKTSERLMRGVKPQAAGVCMVVPVDGDSSETW